jgi:hypothetical protein
MSDMKATVEHTTKGFSVCGYEKIEYDFEFLDGVFNVANVQLAQCYKPWRRCLAVMDLNIFNLYGAEMQKYFDHHCITLKIHKTMIGEKAKSMETLLSIVDSMTEFGIYRKEPVLVVGGGLVTDVAGYAMPMLSPMEFLFLTFLIALLVLPIAATPTTSASQPQSSASSTPQSPSKSPSTMADTRTA